MGEASEQSLLARKVRRPHRNRRRRGAWSQRDRKPWRGALSTPPGQRDASTASATSNLYPLIPPVTLSRALASGLVAVGRYPASERTPVPHSEVAHDCTLVAAGEDLVRAQGPAYLSGRSSGLRQSPSRMGRTSGGFSFSAHHDSEARSAQRVPL